MKRFSGSDKDSAYGSASSSLGSFTSGHTNTRSASGSASPCDSSGRFSSGKSLSQGYSSGYGSDADSKGICSFGNSSGKNSAAYGSDTHSSGRCSIGNSSASRSSGYGSITDSIGRCSIGNSSGQSSSGYGSDTDSIGRCSIGNSSIGSSSWSAYSNSSNLSSYASGSNIYKPQNAINHTASSKSGPADCSGQCIHDQSSAKIDLPVFVTKNDIVGSLNNVALNIPPLYSEKNYKKQSLPVRATGRILDRPFGNYVTRPSIPETRNKYFENYQQAVALNRIEVLSGQATETQGSYYGFTSSENRVEKEKQAGVVVQSVNSRCKNANLSQQNHAFTTRIPTSSSKTAVQQTHQDINFPRTPPRCVVNENYQPRSVENAEPSFNQLPVNNDSARERAAGRYYPQSNSCETSAESAICDDYESPSQEKVEPYIQRQPPKLRCVETITKPTFIGPGQQQYRQGQETASEAGRLCSANENQASVEKVEPLVQRQPVKRPSMGTLTTPSLSGSIQEKNQHSQVTARRGRDFSYAHISAEKVEPPLQRKPVNLQSMEMGTTPTFPGFDHQKNQQGQVTAAEAGGISHVLENATSKKKVEPPMQRQPANRRSMNTLTTLTVSGFNQQNNQQGQVTAAESRDLSYADNNKISVEKVEPPLQRKPINLQSMEVITTPTLWGSDQLRSQQGEITALEAGGLLHVHENRNSVEKVESPLQRQSVKLRTMETISTPIFQGSNPQNNQQGQVIAAESRDLSYAENNKMSVEKVEPPLQRKPVNLQSMEFGTTPIFQGFNQQRNQQGQVTAAEAGGISHVLENATSKKKVEPPMQRQPANRRSMNTITTPTFGFNQPNNQQGQVTAVESRDLSYADNNKISVEKVEPPLQRKPINLQSMEMITTPTLWGSDQLRSKQGEITALEAGGLLHVHENRNSVEKVESPLQQQSVKLRTMETVSTPILQRSNPQNNPNSRVSSAKDREVLYAYENTTLVEKDESHCTYSSGGSRSLEGCASTQDKDISGTCIRQPQKVSFDYMRSHSTGIGLIQPSKKFSRRLRRYNSYRTKWRPTLSTIKEPLHTSLHELGDKSCLKDKGNRLNTSQDDETKRITSLKFVSNDCTVEKADLTSLNEVINGVTNELSCIQRKQTKDHFNLDPDPDQRRPNVFEPVNPFPYEIYGGKRPCQSSETAALSQFINLLQRLSIVEHIPAIGYLQNPFNHSKLLEITTLTSSPKPRKILKLMRFPGTAFAPILSFKSKSTSRKLKAENAIEKSPMTIALGPPEISTLPLSPDAVLFPSMLPLPITESPTVSLQAVSPALETTSTICNVEYEDAASINSDNHRIISISGNRINLDTTLLLDPNTQLADEIMNAFLILTTKIGRQTGLQCEALSVHFVRHTSTRELPNNKHEHVFSDNPLELNYITANTTSLFIPFHSGDHWSLIYVNIPERIVEVIDSIEITSERIQLKIDTFLKIQQLLKAKFPNSEWQLMMNHAVAKQPLGNDCGVYVLAQAFNKIASDTRSWLSSFEPLQVMAFRQRIFQTIYDEFVRKHANPWAEEEVNLLLFPEVTEFNAQLLVSPDNFKNQLMINKWFFERLQQFSDKPFIAIPCAQLKRSRIPNEAFSRCLDVMRPLFCSVPVYVDKIIFCLKQHKRWILLSAEPKTRLIRVFDTMPVNEITEREVELIPIIQLLKTNYFYGSWAFLHTKGIVRFALNRDTINMALWYAVNVIRETDVLLTTAHFSHEDFEEFQSTLDETFLSDSDHSSSESDAVDELETNIALPEFVTNPSAVQSTCNTTESEKDKDTPLILCALCEKCMKGETRYVHMDAGRVQKDPRQKETVEAVAYLKETEHANLFHGGSTMCRTCSTPTVLYVKNIKLAMLKIQEMRDRFALVDTKRSTQNVCVTCKGTLQSKSKLTTKPKRGNMSIGEGILEMEKLGNLGFKDIKSTQGHVCDACSKIVLKFITAFLCSNEMLAKMACANNQESRKTTTARKATDRTGETPKSKKFKKRIPTDSPQIETPFFKDPVLQQAEDIAQEMSDCLTSERRKLIDKEFEVFISSSGWKTLGPPTEKQIQSLDFAEIKQFLTKNCPQICTLFCVDKDGNLDIQPPEIMAISILAFSRNPHFNLLQKMISLDLSRSTTRKQADLLQTLGICTSTSTFYRTADAINSQCDAKLQRWKLAEEKRWETALGLTSDTTVEAQPQVHTPETRKVNRRLESEFEDIVIDGGGTYSFQLDNMDYLIRARHQGIDRSNEFRNETIGFVVKNRIPFSKRSLEVTGRAELLNNSIFDISEEEEKLIRAEKVQLLMYIACLHLPSCKPLQKIFMGREVKFSDESSEKSEIVPLGVISENISTLKGCMAVLTTLDKFIPVVDNRKVIVRVGGDGATYNMTESCKLLRSASLEHESFNHLYSSASSNRFHKGMIRLNRHFQVFGLDDQKSRMSPGSLANIKLTQNHKNATVKVSDSFHFANELSEASLHGYSCLLLMKHLQLEALSSNAPPEVDSSNSTQVLAWLRNAAEAAVNELHENVLPQKGIVSAICVICNDDMESVGVTCFNVACNNFVHLECVRALEPRLVFVEKNLINKKTRVSTKIEAAFCSKKHADLKYYYTLGLLHASLDMKVRRDACRANDAIMMLCHNKVDLQFFHKHGNHQYFKICLHLILSQNDCVPTVITFDEKYNATINMQGKSNRNLEFDLVQEKFVKMAKDEVRGHSGLPGSSSLHRRTQLAGNIGWIKEILQKINCRSYNQKEHQAREFLNETVDFVNLYAAEELLVNVGMRMHESTQQIHYNPLVPQADKEVFFEKIRKLLADYDLRNDVINNFRNERREERRYKDFPMLTQETSWVVGNSLVRKHPAFPSILQEFPLVHIPNDVQFEVAEKFSTGCDCFVSLPTSFGKSLIIYYAALLKHVTNELKQLTITLIVAPLLSIVHDQIRMLRSLGLEGRQVTQSNMIEIENGLVLLRQSPNCSKNVLFLFITPEFMQNAGAQKFLKKLQPDFLVNDESHLIHAWGSDFRPCFDEIGKLRVSFNGPILAMSATLSKAAFHTAVTSLNLKSSNPETMFCLASPNRPNIYLSVQEPKQKNKFIGKLAAGLLAYGTNFPKTVIYFESHTEIKLVYFQLMSVLKANAFTGDRNCTQTRMVQTYYANQGDDTKAFIASTFAEKNSSIRLLLATVAYGIGVDLPDLRTVAYFQSQKTGKKRNVVPLMDFIQCFGRCSRDRRPGIAILFSKDMANDKCIREQLMDMCQTTDEPLIEIQSVSDLVKPCFDDCKDGCYCTFCQCCMVCRETCKCQQDNPTEYLDFFIPPVQHDIVVEDCEEGLEYEY